MTETELRCEQPTPPPPSEASIRLQALQERQHWVEQSISKGFEQTMMSVHTPTRPPGSARANRSMQRMGASTARCGLHVNKAPHHRAALRQSPHRAAPCRSALYCANYRTAPHPAALIAGLFRATCLGVVLSGLVLSGLVLSGLVLSGLVLAAITEEALELQVERKFHRPHPAPCAMSLQQLCGCS